MRTGNEARIKLSLILTTLAVEAVWRVCMFTVSVLSSFSRTACLQTCSNGTDPPRHLQSHRAATSLACYAAGRHGNSVLLTSQTCALAAIESTFRGTRRPSPGSVSSSMACEPSELRQRLVPENGDEEERRSAAGDEVPRPPYEGKVYLARKKKPDPLYVRIIEAVVIVGTVAAGLYCYYYFDNVHFHVTNGYAHLGYSEAQHQVGQRYLHGVGVEKHAGKAMEWFRKAADQGHPHAAYNLAVAHLKGYRTDLKPGESHRLIHHAASKGVKEAHHVLNNVCTLGHCV